MPWRESFPVQPFGPNATGQVSQEQITSRSFGDLKEFLVDPETADNDEIGTLIQNANWIIFDMLDVDIGESPSSDVI